MRRDIRPVFRYNKQALFRVRRARLRLFIFINSSLSVVSVCCLCLKVRCSLLFRDRVKKS